MFTDREGRGEEEMKEPDILRSSSILEVEASRVAGARRWWRVVGFGDMVRRWWDGIAA